MQTLPIGRYRFFQRIQPSFILNNITSTPKTGCLQVFSNSNSWLIYLDKGKLVYACYAEGMFDLLYKKLQVFSQQIPTINRDIYKQLKAIFENAIDNQAIPNPDYLAICWLVNQKHISSSQAGILIEELAIEVLNTFLKLEEGSYEFINDSFLGDMPKFCYLEMNSLVDRCQNRHRQFYSQKTHQEKGNHSYQNASHRDSKNNTKHQEKLIYTIMCVDDSITIINAIKSFLDEQYFDVIGVNDSLKALMQIIRNKPDLILLDIGMPNLDGYELCSLLRKHSYFKNTPVIMVTARTGLIDKAKAKMVRASGYLTKPFTQAELMKIIFQHLDIE